MKVDKSYGAMTRLARWVLAIPMILLPLLLGGARPWLWSTVAAVFMLGLVATAWVEDDFRPTPGIAAGWSRVLPILLAFPFLQALPLRQSWVSLISAQRWLWLQQVADATAINPWPASISYAPLTTLFAGIWWLFLLLFALLLHRTVRSEGPPTWLFVILFIVAGFEACYGLLQVLIPSLGVVGGGDVATHYAGYARGTFINRNHFACFLTMVWPLLIAYTMGIADLRNPNFEIRISNFGLRISKRKPGAQSYPHYEPSYAERERLSQVRQKQMFLWFVVALVFMALLFSASRGGILSAFVGLTVFVTFGGSRRKGILIFVAGCWLIVLAYGSIIGFGEILGRFDLIEESAASRFEIWATGWRIIKDHVWTGSGLGTFGDLFRVYQDYLDDILTTDHAHNDHVQLTVELGVPAAVSMFVLVWGYWLAAAWRLGGGRRPAGRGERVTGAQFRKLQVEKEKAGSGIEDYGSSSKSARAVAVDQGYNPENGRSRRKDGRRPADFRNPPAADRNLISVGALAGSAAFLCHGWVEFNWQIPANALYFVLLLVLLDLR